MILGKVLFSSQDSGRHLIKPLRITAVTPDRILIYLSSKEKEADCLERPTLVNDFGF